MYVCMLQSRSVEDPSRAIAASHWHWQQSLEVLPAGAGTWEPLTYTHVDGVNLHYHSTAAYAHIDENHVIERNSENECPSGLVLSRMRAAEARTCT